MMLWLKFRQLSSSDPAVRRKAMQQLCESPTPRALEALTSALQDEDEEVRHLAVQALAKLEDDRRIEPLLLALKDRAPEVLKAAISGLRKQNDERVTAALVPLIFNVDAGVRGHAAQVLDSMGWKPANRDEEIWHDVARNQLPRAAGYGIAALPALETVLNGGPYTLRVAAIEAIGAIDDKRILRPLFAALKSTDPAVCGAAVEVLCNIGDPQCIEPILEVLNHPGAHPRATAADALGRLNATAAAARIRLTLRDTSWHVRKAAVEALGRLKDKDSVPEMTKLLQDSDPDVRETAALALGNIGDRHAIGPLVKALKDPHSGVRRIATAALARIDENWSSSVEVLEAVQELKAGLEDKDPEVRHLAGKLLASLGHEATAVAAAASSEDHLSVTSLEKRRKLAVSLFLATLCDEDPDLRQAAAESLGRMGDHRALAGLQKALGDADEGVRLAVEEAVKTLELSHPAS